MFGKSLIKNCTRNQVVQKKKTIFLLKIH